MSASQEKLSPDPTPTIQPTRPPPFWRLRTPQEAAAVFCALGIIATFFAPWLRVLDSSTVLDLGPHATGTHLSGAYFFYYFEGASKAFIVIPLLALFTVLCLRRSDPRRRIGTVTALVVWGAIARLSYLAHAPFSFANVDIAWGSRLCAWFALGLFAFCGDLSLPIRADFVVKKLRSRKADVFSHWLTPVPGFHFSTQDFYAGLEKAVGDKQWPGVRLIRLAHSEAGLLSHKREYIRVIRHRQVFDICAAPFGKDYFFSVREAEIPAVVNLRAILTVILALSFALYLSVELLGIIFGPAALLFVVAGGVWFFFNALKMGLTNVDSLLIQLPVVGPVYEAWFRRDTFFQQDTRFFFLHAVSELVKERVEDITSAKGLKYLERFDHQPVLDGIYKRSRIEFEARQEPVANAA